MFLTVAALVTDLHQEADTMREEKAKATVSEAHVETVESDDTAVTYTW